MVDEGDDRPTPNRVVKRFGKHQKKEGGKHSTPVCVAPAGSPQNMPGVYEVEAHRAKGMTTHTERGFLRSYKKSDGEREREGGGLGDMHAWVYHRPD